MTNLPYKIHEALTERRRQATPVEMPDLLEISHSHQPDKMVLSKEYPRMPRIKLLDLADNGVTLLKAIKQRRSSQQVNSEPLSFESISYILAALGVNDRGSRTYPSGGALYPIETYLLTKRVSGLEQGAYHYHALTNSLEYLWPTKENLEIFKVLNPWAKDARALLIFTGSWYKSSFKYRDFSYLLGLIETGHIAQNVLLTAAALEIPACPLAGLNDDEIVEILDLNPRLEQPVYCIALG